MILTFSYVALALLPCSYFGKLPMAVLVSGLSAEKLLGVLLANQPALVNEILDCLNRGSSWKRVLEVPASCVDHPEVQQCLKDHIRVGHSLPYPITHDRDIIVHIGI